MDRMIRTSCVVILMANICFELILANQKELLLSNQRFEPVVEGSKIKDDDESKIPSIWFSPRLGRKKRTLKDDEHKLNEQELEDLFAYDKAPVSLILIKKNGDTQLICKNVPGNLNIYDARPGRSVEDDIGVNDKYLQDTDNSAEYMFQRSPPFAPRLGKRFSPYSPRLGREL